MIENLTPVWGIAALVLVAMLLIWALIKRYRVAQPNEAFIITGRKGKASGDLSGQKVVTGGGAFVLPFIQQLSVLDMSSRRIPVEVKGAPSSQGIMLNVSGVAVVKVHNEEDSIRSAAQRFGNQQNEIDNFTTDELSGALRAIVGNMSVEEIIRDRERFSQQVLTSVTNSLTQQGLNLDAFTIQEVTDYGQGTYISDMGRASAAEIRRQAEIAEAEAHRQSEEKRIAAQTEVANYQRGLDLRQAAILAETDRARAQSSAAGPLEEAARKQEILAAEEVVAERRATLTERELDTTVRRPADAERYRAEQEAEARKMATVRNAEASRDESKLRAEGELAIRTAEASAIEIEGKASASAIQAKGLAEAEALAKHAESYKLFNNAATLDRILQALPGVAHELAAPMSSISNLTVVSTEGASALPKMVANNFTQLTEVIKSVTGVDLNSFLQDAAGQGSTIESPPLGDELK